MQEVETLHFVQSDIGDNFATTFQVGTTLRNRQCKPEKKNGQEKSFAALVAGMVDRDVISMVDTPHTRDKRRMANLTSWQQTARSWRIFFDLNRLSYYCSLPARQYVVLGVAFWELLLR